MLNRVTTIHPFVRTKIFWSSTQTILRSCTHSLVKMKMCHERFIIF